MFRDVRTQRHIRTFNFPQVRPPPPPPPHPLTHPRIKTRIFVEQHPNTSFASSVILDFRLIVISYVNRSVSWHPLSQMQWLQFTVSEGELVKSCLLTPIRAMISNYSGQDILLLDQQKRFLTSTNREALPVTKTEALRHFILGMKQPLHLEATSSRSESVTVYIQSFTSEPKIKYPCGKRERIPFAPLPAQSPC